MIVTKIYWFFSKDSKYIATRPLGLYVEYTEYTKKLSLGFKFFKK